MQPEAVDDWPCCPYSPYDGRFPIALAAAAAAAS